MRKNSLVKTVATLALGCTVALCGLALVGCNDDKAADTAGQTQEQDNCYGDDMPVIAGQDQEQDNCYGDDMPVIATNA